MWGGGGGEGVGALDGGIGRAGIRNLFSYFFMKKNALGSHKKRLIEYHNMFSWRHKRYISTF